MLRFWLNGDLPLPPEYEPVLPLLAKPFGTPETTQLCEAEPPD